MQPDERQAVARSTEGIWSASVKQPETARDTQVGGSHYKNMDVQPWDVVDTWPLEQRIGFYRGNALKYIMRMGTKDVSLQEIQKGMHYLQKLVETLSKQA